METTDEKLSRLLNAKYLSPSDQQWIRDYIVQHGIEDVRLTAYEEYCSDLALHNKINTVQELEEPFKQVYQNLLISKKEYPFKRWTKLVGIAASVAAGLTLFAYIFTGNTHQLANTNLTAKKIGPGGNKAILTLADGSQIVLGNMTEGVLLNKGNIAISQNSNGQIIYDASGQTNSNGKVEYNTISTPKAGQYQVILADGTKVWLNSVSSIRFPTSFNGPGRKVEITGEAYFEVTKNKHKPFQVLSGGQIVEVLGTHFNINAYRNEDAIKTTLLEGSVKVTKGTQTAMLTPGQQASAKNTINVTDDADLEEVVSWKNGMFHFKDASVPTVMKQLERWYDVSVKYEGKIPVKELNGKLSRSNDLPKLLEMLGYAGIGFRIKDHTIIVTEK